VEILEEQEERLDLTFPEESRLTASMIRCRPLRRVEGVPRGIVGGGHPAAPGAASKNGSSVPVQRQEFARHSFANLSLVVALLDPQICLQQLDNGQVRRGPP